MHPRRLLLIFINLLGGIAVLGSYAHGIASHADSGAALWGHVPDAIRPLYNVSMLTAAAGYFLFAPYVIFRLDPDRARVGGRFGYNLYAALFALILIPSALWMPLTFAWRASPSDALWLVDRVVLFLVGIGSVGLLLALMRTEPVPSVRGRRLAILGAALFTFQTAVLDALVWPHFYRG